MSQPGAKSQDTKRCLVRSVAEEMEREPSLEAVTIDRVHKTISVATLGRTDVPKITERVRETIEQASDLTPSSCNLLAEKGDCYSCDRPLNDSESHRITVTHTPDSTTIARVTCPTAPKFWRWKQIPWPKIVQRDIEFLEHADEIDEWKGQMVAAVLCGAFALTGGLFHDSKELSVAAYVLAYIFGSWFTAQEVWAHLKRFSIDVHFLMLAVAGGSAAIGAWG